MVSRQIYRYRLLLAFMLAATVCPSAAAVQLNGVLNVHDPSTIIKEDGRYYVYATGAVNAPIQLKYSDNFTTWQNGPSVFNGIPAWAQAEVPNNGGNIWAPDIIKFNDEYRLYYSVSSFGSRDSAIGLATNTTLDFTDPNYQWVDKELVIKSENGSANLNPYNAIDPSIFFDESTERMWMTWGSFTRGIYMTELDPNTGKRITPDSATINIARRAQGAGSAIEAPYLTEHDGYYYLFVNWDTCCQGTGSTYNIRVGRAESPTGPFVDKNGVAMLSGGGTLLLGTEGSRIGPGHFSNFSESGRNYFGYHFYDGTNSGAPTYGIDEFYWGHDGWPLLAVDSPLGDYNRDGVVNAGDYTIWRDTLGSTTDLRANGNNIRGSAGVIDQADYLIWKANFGTSGLGAGAGSGEAAGMPVPEPSTMLLVAFALSAVGRPRLFSLHRV